MIQRLLLLWLVLSSGAAFYWPRQELALRLPTALPGPLRDWLSDPFVHSGGSLYYAIAVTMLAIGLMLPRDEVQQVFRRWPSVLGGTALQYTTMPLLAYAAARLWRMEENYLIGMVMVGCVPGAMASNVLTLNARGNTSYSVSLTTCATLLSPVAVPLVLALLLATGHSQIDHSVLTGSAGMLILTVVLPVVAGHLLTRRFRSLEKPARRWGPLTANLAILWIIAVVVGRSRGPLAEIRFDLVVALLAVNVAGYAAGYAGGFAMRLPEPMRRALTLEIGMQNAGLGATLADRLFRDAPHGSEITVAPALYTFGCMLTGTMLSAAWAIYSERRTRSCSGETAGPT